MAKTLVGVMGPGEGASPEEQGTAYQLGRRIAQENWGLLTGGRNVGIMEAANRGAQTAGGLVVGILPGSTSDNMSSSVDIPIVTGVGHARNVINVLSSQAVIVCGLGAGTLSEIALAIKLKKPLVLMHVSDIMQAELQRLTKTPLVATTTVETAIAQVKQALQQQHTA